MTQEELDAKAELKTLRTKMRELDTEGDGLAGSFKTVDGTLVIDTETRNLFQKNLAFREELRTNIDLLERQAGLKDFMGAPEGGSAAAAVAAFAAGQRMGQSSKSLSEMFLGSDQFKQFKASGKTNMDAAWELKVADFAGIDTKDVYGSGVTQLVAEANGRAGSPNVFGSVFRDEFVELQHRKMRIRDLFRVIPTQAKVIEFFRVTGFTNNASPIPDVYGTDLIAQAVKIRRSALSFESQSQMTKTIGHYEVAHQNALDDEAQLASIIDGELMYGLQLEEDAQILYGNQSTNSEDLPGILNDAGIQTFVKYGVESSTAGASTDNANDALRRAMTKVFISNFEPTGVVVHPSDWETMELVKSSTGEYLMAVSIAVGGEPKIWGVPVVQSQALTAGTALTGAFGLGCKLWDRAEASIRIADQHADLFLKNALVLLAQERLALTMQRPQSFVKVTLA